MSKEIDMILVKQGGSRFWVSNPKKIKFYQERLAHGGEKGFPTEILKVKYRDGESKI